MKKFENGFLDYLTTNITIVGKSEIPMLMDLDNTQIPNDIIPFSKMKYAKDKRVYVHCYEYDHVFSELLTNTKKFLSLIKQFDGFITPDCSLLIGDSRSVQQINTFLNRAVGLYLQKQGIPVIPNIRWSDESSFDHCFLGVPKNTIVAISTHGCIQKKEEKEMFKIGLDAMLNELQPKSVIVHGYMPDSIFGEYLTHVDFHRYKSNLEKTRGGDYGNRL